MGRDQWLIPQSGQTTNLNEKQGMKYDVVVVGDLVWHETDGRILHTFLTIDEVH